MQGFEDRQELLLGHDQRVAIGQKNFPEGTVGCTLVDFTLDLSRILDAERTALVSRAKSTSVVRTTQRDLKDQAICLAGGTNDNSFIFHGARRFSF